MRNLIILVLLCSGCDMQATVNTPATATNKPAIFAPTLPNIAFPASIMQNGELVATAIGFSQNEDVASGVVAVQVYIPSTDQYAEIDIATGKYIAHIVEWDRNNCTGMPFIGGISGATTAIKSLPHGIDPNKFVFSDVANFYAVNSFNANPNQSTDISEASVTYPKPGAISYADGSESPPGTCRDFAESIFNDLVNATLTEITQPYDFTVLAPIALPLATEGK